MDWCLSELIRLKGAIPLEDAQALLDAIADREMAVIWAAPGGMRQRRRSS